MPNRIPFTTAREQQAMCAVLNRFESCLDSQEFIEATEFSHAFDREMVRLDRDAFWKTTEEVCAK